MMNSKDKEHFSSLLRQQLTFAACDALAVVRKKPSVSLVREMTIELAGIKKGSDGDVQEDIRLWFEGLFALKRDAAIDGLPEQMATLFRASWRGAVELARKAWRRIVSNSEPIGSLQRARSIAHAHLPMSCAISWSWPTRASTHAMPRLPVWTARSRSGMP